jgi:16S rRNA (uracil1498-N3)-methyltransferase
MELFFCDPLEKDTEYIQTDKFEQKHMIHTLRKKTGDVLIFTDGHGNKITGKIESVKPEILIKVVGNEFVERPKNRLGIAIGFIRSNRLDWLIEKITELGVSHIYLIKMQYSNYSSNNLERYQKIIRQALKQSVQYYAPKIESYNSLKAFLATKMYWEQKIYALSSESKPLNHYLDSFKTSKSLSILTAIGPEGGFHSSEVDLLKDSGYIDISLGANRLRTETAAISALSGIQLYTYKIKEENVGKR